MVTPPEIKRIIEQLSADPHLVAECSSCSELFKIKDANLFYGNELTDAAKEYLKEREQEVADARKNLLKAQAMATTGAALRTKSVNFGKVLEKVAPALAGFPFNKNDCRALFEPIDYLVFDGLTARNHVNQLVFLDIKTGNASLNEHQKQIKAAVQRGDVALQVLK